MRAAFCFGLALLSVFIAQPSHALDSKIYTGHYCRMQYYSDSMALSYFEWGAYNPHTSGEWFVCPVVRDVTGSTQAMTSAWIVVDDWNDQQNVGCYFKSVNPFTGSYYYSNVDGSGISTTGTRIRLDFSAFSSAADHHILFTCYVAGKTAGGSQSGIRAYKVNEP